MGQHSLQIAEKGENLVRFTQILKQILSENCLEILVKWFTLCGFMSSTQAFSQHEPIPAQKLPSDHCPLIVKH